MNYFHCRIIVNWNQFGKIVFDDRVILCDCVPIQTVWKVKSKFAFCKKLVAESNQITKSMCRFVYNFLFKNININIRHQKPKNRTNFVDFNEAGEKILSSNKTSFVRKFVSNDILSFINFCSCPNTH